MSSSLDAESLSAWNVIAPYWDDTIGKDGNKYWRLLQEPSLSRLLGPNLAKPGCRALDLATGNGLCARWLAGRGAKVYATDGSEVMVGIAKGRSEGCGIEFGVLDVTSKEGWEGFLEGEGREPFDIVLMNMAIMDVGDIEPLAAALPKLLQKGGTFVATILHPVFFTSNAAKSITIDFDPETGEQRVVRSKVITEYMSVAPAKGVAHIGQPKKQICWHRPIGELYTTFFKAGLVLDGMEELAFTEADGNEERVDSSANYTQLPALLAFRLRISSA
ncbi:S-adenosyl-L-methionine-dependent methyltransferase [Cercophora newfieldiana]|uniref:S-adenosyl-L-methionine-dependent methyltransferase n=1 Tax=Cercophora newfieldiana TaxID=92897 RepID=A0AA39Y155_9PEZI|nr:S-adenosyl-L-methionine-dependent methyltransferase [Cercophora newfieldiana]